MTSAGEVSWAELHYSRLTSKPARDAIRQAVASAKHGPVWLVNRDGRRTGAIVSGEDAAFLREIRRGLHEAETGQLADRLRELERELEGALDERESSPRYPPRT